LGLIGKIRFRIRTADTSDAGTDGEIYVGICGREFHIDSQHDDFERASERTYSSDSTAVPGEVNVNNPTFNNPSADPPLFTEDLDLYPVYVRFEPRNKDDHWTLQYISVTVAGIKYEALEPEDDTAIFTKLGYKSGKWLYLHLERRLGRALRRHSTRGKKRKKSGIK
jgi:hypothetical protein